MSTSAHESPQLLAFADGYGICVAVAVASAVVLVYDEPEIEAEVPDSEASIEDVEPAFLG